MANQTLTMLVHGEAGVGKSTLGDTSPAPRLILDAEGRARYLPSEPKVQWDPMQEAPPEYDGNWQTCVATVPDYQTMEQVYRWLQSGQHSFVSVIIDSLMEVQKRLIDDVAGMEQLKHQDWGEVLRRLEKLTRDYRDLVLSPHVPTRCVVVTTGSKNEEGKMRPMLQGQMARSLPYIVDVIGYLYVTMAADNQSLNRSMLVAPLPAAVAKDDTGRFQSQSPVLQEPNLYDMFEQLNGQEENKE